MKMQTSVGTWLALTSLTLGVATPAMGATLKVGDPAPKLQVAKWVQGKPVKEFEAGQAYIVEFWATWCGPCRVSIPHLNELHGKFKDKKLVVIGQDCWERDESLVVPFVKKMGEKMTYRVALDDKNAEKDGAMAVNWMKAAGQNGIPTAFIVNPQGKIAWIGHPMELKEALLEDVLAGRYDLKKAAAEYEANEKQKEAQMALSRKLSTSLAKKNWDDAEAAVAEMEKSLPEKERDNFAMARFEISAGRKDYDGAYKLLRAYSDAHADEGGLQNEIAWTIVARKDLEKRDLALAQTAAERANKATKGEDAATLDTLARVQFMTGKKAEAIATQEKAVAKAEGDMKKDLEKSLASYKAGKLPDAEE